MTASPTNPMFDPSAPPPPDVVTGRAEPIYSDEEIKQAIERLVKEGYIGLYCKTKREASTISMRLSRAVMRSASWTPMFGEPFARWVTSSVVENGNGYWAYARVQPGRFVEREGRKVFRIDAKGQRRANGS